MDDGQGYKPTTDEIWSPSPALPPLKPVRPPPLFIRGGILVPILLTQVEVSVMFGYEYLCVVRPAHTILWRNFLSSHALVFVLLLPFNIWTCSRRVKQEHRVAAALALEARAAGQSATE